MNRHAASVLIALAALSCPGLAHEFWIEAERSDPPPGAVVQMTFRVGEYFIGEQVGVTASHAESVRVLSTGRHEDLTHRVPTGSMLPSLPLTFARAGTHVIAYESHPSQVVLSADKFHAYLHDEGLDEIVRQREAAGTAASPGRERFRRSAKALVRVGPRADRGFERSSGQRLEILPLDDPLSAGPGMNLRFALRFEGQPRPGVLVKAWHRSGRQTTVIRSTTDGQGRFSMTLPFAGDWMLNAVHMRPATGSADVDWDSYWGSLTFALPRRR